MERKECERKVERSLGLCTLMKKKVPSFSHKTEDVWYILRYQGSVLCTSVGGGGCGMGGGGGGYY